MNRNCYRLVFKASLGMLVPTAECARANGKAQGSVTLAGVVLAGSLGFAPLLRAELPVGSASFVTHGQAAVQTIGNQMNINQVGDKSVLNWQSFNISAGSSVQFRQVDNLTSNNLVQGASFTSLNRIWDINPSVIAGAITQGAGQKGNIILVNSNGIAFMGGSQVNLNSFAASTLNIADGFITGSFLTNNTQTPQFEKALDGSAAKGFIKVFEGARISATDSGRVMLIAPTVVNRGTVTAEGGQVIAAAASRVFLRSASGQDSSVRGLLVEVDSDTLLTGYDQANADVKDGVLDGATVALTNTADDKLGHVTNIGNLQAARGNVTMIGYAVNQMGVARATSAVLENGSVYLLAKDRASSNASSDRAGRVVLGSGSVTEVGIERGGKGAADWKRDTGLVDEKGEKIYESMTTLETPSRVDVLGQLVNMESGASIVAPSGVVNITALDKPSDLNGTSTDPFRQSSTVSTTARVHIAEGARISVAGLENVAVDVARNIVEVELRGDELKDSPLNRSGALRGKTVYLDVNKALANAKAGVSTLIAEDSLENYSAKLERTAAERATAGGKVTVRSQGEAILESGAVVDLSGGNVQYQAGFIKTTTLSAGGQSVDIADANANTRYDGIANSLTLDYGRWNKQETVQGASTYRYSAGYTEGKNAGTLAVVGMKATVLQAEVQGRTTTGERQQAVASQPKGATLVLGSAALSEDYKLNQAVVVARQSALLGTGFDFGDVLPAAQAATLTLDADLLGKNKVANLEIYSNQAVTVRDALRLPDNGSVTVVGTQVLVQADVVAHGGRIDLAARNNNVSPSTGIDVQVASGVRLDTSGVWNNLLPGMSAANSPLRPIDAGVVKLTADGLVALGAGSVIDVQGGATVSAANKLSLGDGGDVNLSGNQLSLEGTVLGYAPGEGGTLTLSAQKMKIGGTADATAFNLDTGLLDQGFASYVLKGSESLEVADGTVLRPRVVSREIHPSYRVQATGSDLQGFSHLVQREDVERQAADLSLASAGTGETDGRIRVGTGARIEADTGAIVKLEARNGMVIDGLIQAQGGSITASVSRNSSHPYDATAALWLGSGAVLDASGVAQTYTDSQGLVQGQVLNAGAITLTANNAGIVSQQGSRILLDGAGPVVLAQPNEQGGQGRTVASDGGSLTLSTTEAALLDGSVSAQAGASGRRGGRFSFDLKAGDAIRGPLANGGNGAPDNERTLILQQAPGLQAAALAAGDALPASSNGNVVLSADALRTAGFDEISLKSKDAIRLDGNVQIAAAGNLPLGSLTLDAGRIETQGGNVGLSAHAVTLTNSASTATGGTPVAGTGSLTVDGALVTVAGHVTVSGIGQLTLQADEAVRLTGAPTDAGGVADTGSLTLASDLTVDSPLTAPSTDVAFTVKAPGQRVAFTNSTGAAALTPYSVQGSVTVQAREISQGSTLHAPFGQIDLQASELLEFKAGSVTSVSGAGAQFSYGRVENGRSWVGGVEGSGTTVTTLEGKAVRASGQTIDMQAGAVVDLSGGGGVQAHEFTVGPGGSADILARSGTYAVLPGYASGFAPGDGQEAFNAKTGTTVYLSGVPGLAAGYYTLLPAHYALLPGAYAVRLDTGMNNVLPNQSYARADGAWVSSGYLSDSRSNAPKDANWQGIEVLSREQVRERSEFTLTQASDFFAGSRNRPEDAGLLSISTTGTGASALALDATYRMAAARGGQAAAVDIAAANLVITGPNATGVDPNAVQVSVEQLQRLGAASLLLGGTRTNNATGAALTAVASNVVLANDSNSALQAPEVMLMARDQITLAPGSVIDAQGDSTTATAYTTTGDGAFVRAASSEASFVRSGSTNTTGRIEGTAGAGVAPLVRAADAITLDATQSNQFEGRTLFEKNGVAVAGKLGVGAARINFVGDSSAAAGLPGISYGQDELDGMSSLAALTLTSYSSFDVYGNAQIGGRDANGSPTLKALTLQGAGLRGLDNTGQTASVNAQQMHLNNAGGVALPATGALGSGALELRADVLTLGTGNKEIKGFAAVDARANELKGVGMGSTTVSGAPLTVVVRQISGAGLSQQTLGSDAALVVRDYLAGETAPVVRAITADRTLGAEWTLKGASVNFDTTARLHSGELTLTASSGDVQLGSQAVVDVSGRLVDFFDVQKPSEAGRVTITAAQGNVALASGARVDVSGAAGGDAGELALSAVNGSVSLARNSVVGGNPANGTGQTGEGARVAVDTKTLASYSDLNDALNDGGFSGQRNLRVRSGDISVAAADVTRAQNIALTADDGAISLAGTLDASGAQAGRIVVQASGNVELLSGARLAAESSQAGLAGGQVELATRSGSLNLDAGSRVDVGGGGTGDGGELLLRAPRVGSDVGVGTLAAVVSGASRIDVEALRTYAYAGNVTLDNTANETGTTLGLGKINSDNTAYAVNHAAITTRLGQDGNAAFRVIDGVEVTSTGNMTLGSDWNLASSRPGGNAGNLTLRAAGDLNLNNNLSDGFNLATPTSGATPATGTPAILGADDSWAYRLVAGADTASANAMAMNGTGNLAVAAGKLVRTGTGDIRMAAGGNITLASNTSAIYTAGKAATALAGFTAPTNAQFSTGGGDVELKAGGNISSATRSAQLYSGWLFRQGGLNLAGTAYTAPAWWVRFDRFQQGVATLGGGNVSLASGGNISNLSASAATQARSTGGSSSSAATLNKSGGGSVRVAAGGDVLGGQFYADGVAAIGKVRIRAEGKIGAGDKVGSNELHTIVALGNAQADVLARGDVNIHAVINPHLVQQSSGSGINLNIANANSALWSLFSSYTDNSAASLASMAGDVNFHNRPQGSTNDKLAGFKDVGGAYGTTFNLSTANYALATAMGLLPGSLSLVSFQDDVLLGGGGASTLTPAARGQLTLLAGDNVTMLGRTVLSDLAPLPDATRPVRTTADFAGSSHALTPVHAGDSEPVRVYAVEGDVRGMANAQALDSAKAVRVKAGRDVIDLGMKIQHVNADDVSQIGAGRDIRFSTETNRSIGAYIWVGGAGRLEMTAGRDLDLGTSAGVVSRGNLDNSALPTRGADLELAAGLGRTAGIYNIDNAAVLARLVSRLQATPGDEATLWLARWLTGNAGLDAATALPAVQALTTAAPEMQRTQVRDMLFSALRATGRDANDAQSSYGGNYDRGYAALELLFPGSGAGTEVAQAGRAGDINLFASRVLTEAGGNIDLLAPSGRLIAGLTNTPEVLTRTEVLNPSANGQTDTGVLGIAVVAEGSIRGATRDDMLVNQSRILTVGGGDILLWSSAGDIDAGKGKKSAAVVPPPLTLVKPDGSVTRVLQGAASGSGIGALQPLGGTAGDVDLIAPRGTVNAGDAGIRAGNLNIAAQAVLGAENIKVSGTSTGTPLVDNSAVSASSSGATSRGEDAGKSIAAATLAASDAARNAQALANEFKPTLVRVDVLGFGE